MKIAFISAARGQTGSTTACLMSSMFMAMRYQKEVGYIPVSPNVQGTLDYLDIDTQLTDISNSVSQMYKLLELGQIKPAELRAYCKPVIPKYDIYDMNDPTLGQDKILASQRKLIDVLPYEYVFVDIEFPWDHPCSVACVEACDIVVVVVNQNNQTLNIVETIKEFPHIKKRHLIVIVNNYNQYILDQTKVVKHPALPKGETMFLHYNPYVMQYMNNQRFIDLMGFVDEEDWHAMELTEDLCRICDLFAMHEGDMLKGRDHKRRKKVDPPALRGGFKI